MPSLEDIDCRQGCAVMWERYGTTRQGQPVLRYPVEVGVRWVNRRGETLDPKGQTQATDADVAVDRAVPVGSIMWRGSLSEVPGTADPPEPSGDLFEVLSSSTAEDLKGRTTRYELKLRRWNDTLPATVNPTE